MTTSASDLSAELSKLEKGYELLGELSRDEMVIVFVARDRLSGNEVTVKVLRAADARGREGLAHYASDARLLTALEHPNIVTVHTVKWLSENVVAVITERVRGPSLRQVLDVAGTLPVARATEVLKSLGRALAWAHSSQIMHRDVRPENVIFEDGTGRVVLSDFGLARRIDAGDGIGDQYRAPELADGRYPDRRTDVYSLGIVGWELLTGRRPWPDTMEPIPPGERPPSPPPLAAIRPGLPEALVSAIEGAVQLDRDRRIPDVTAFLERLTGVAPPPRPQPQPEDEDADSFVVDPSAWVALPVPKLPSKPAPPTAAATAGGAVADRPGAGPDIDREVEREVVAEGGLTADAAAASPGAVAPTAAEQSHAVEAPPASGASASTERAAPIERAAEPESWPSVQGVSTATAQTAESERAAQRADREVPRPTERDVAPAPATPPTAVRSSATGASGGIAAEAMTPPGQQVQAAFASPPPAPPGESKRRRIRRDEAQREPTTTTPPESVRAAAQPAAPAPSPDLAPPPAPGQPTLERPSAPVSGRAPHEPPQAGSVRPGTSELRVPTSGVPEPRKSEEWVPGAQRTQQEEPRTPQAPSGGPDRHRAPAAEAGRARRAGAAGGLAGSDVAAGTGAAAAAAAAAAALPGALLGTPPRADTGADARAPGDASTAGVDRESATPAPRTPDVRATTRPDAERPPVTPTETAAAPPGAPAASGSTTQPDPALAEPQAQDFVWNPFAPDQMPRPADAGTESTIAGPGTSERQPPLSAPVRGHVRGSPTARPPLRAERMRGGLGTPRAAWSGAPGGEAPNTSPATPLDPVFDTPAEFPLPVMPDPRPLPPDTGAGAAGRRSWWTRRGIAIAAGLVVLAGAGLAIARMERAPETGILIEPENPIGYGGDVDTKAGPAVDSTAPLGPSSARGAEAPAEGRGARSGGRASTTPSAPTGSAPGTPSSAAPAGGRPSATQPAARPTTPAGARSNAAPSGAGGASSRRATTPARTGAAPGAAGGAATGTAERGSPTSGATTAAATSGARTTTPNRASRSPAVNPARTWDERAEGFARCNSPGLADQRACIAAHLARNDAGLNQVYNDVVAAMRRRANTAPGDPDPPEVQRLRAAQRSWIARRDAECRRRGRGREGPLWAPQRAQCLEEMSLARGRELSNTLARLRRD